MKVHVARMSSGEYDVQIERPVGVQSHRITLGAGFLADVPEAGTDGSRIVVAALEVLDDRRQLGALPPFVDLARYRSERGFLAAVRGRVG